MDFMVSAETDIGIVKNTNQDSLSVKIIDTYQGRMAFAIVCDGMGGLQKGEVASATVIKAFDKWVNEQLPILTRQTLDQSVIFSQWKDIISGQNEIIGRYGDSQGILTRVKQEKEEFHKYIIPQNTVDKITILIDYK